MGKTAKKSATKVDSVDVALAPVDKKTDKGQRDAKEVVEKQVDSKNKLKAVNGGVTQEVEEKKSPLSEDSSSSFDDRIPAKKLETDSDDPSSYGSIRSYDERDAEEVVDQKQVDSSSSGYIDETESDDSSSYGPTPYGSREEMVDTAAKKEDTSDVSTEGDSYSDSWSDHEKSDIEEDVIGSYKSSSDDEEDEKPPKKKRKLNSQEDSSDESSYEELQKKKLKPQTPDTPQATGSKTLFMANLSFSSLQDVKNFFKDAGKVVDVRFTGYAHVDFATPEAAQKALKLNNKDLMGRSVRLELTRERGALGLASRNEKPFRKGQGTVFVRGFDTKGGLGNVKNALEKHFGNCGEITRTFIPRDYESGNLRGYAYIDFEERNGFDKALELDQSKVGGKLINVEEARPRYDSSRPRPTPDSDSKEMRVPGKRVRPSSDNTSREPRRSSGPSKPSITTWAKGTKTIFADD